MHGIRPKVGRRGGAEIGWVGRLFEFAEKPSIAKGKKHVALDITKKRMSIFLAPTDLCHPLITRFGTGWGGSDRMSVERYRREPRSEGVTVRGWNVTLSLFVHTVQTGGQ